MSFVSPLIPSRKWAERYLPSPVTMLYSHVEWRCILNLFILAISSAFYSDVRRSFIMKKLFRRCGSRFGIFSSIIISGLCINSHLCVIHVGVGIFPVGVGYF